MRGTLYRRKPESCPTWTHIWKTLHKIHITTCCPILIFLYFTVLLYLHMLHLPYLQALTLRFSVYLPVGQVPFKIYLPELIFYLPENYLKISSWTTKKKISTRESQHMRYSGPEIILTIHPTTRYRDKTSELDLIQILQDSNVPTFFTFFSLFFFLNSCARCFQLKSTEHLISWEFGVCLSS